MKRRQAYNQAAIEKEQLYEKHTKDYGSGIGLEIGSSRTERPKKDRNKNVCNVSAVQQHTLQANQKFALLIRQMLQQKNL